MHATALRAELVATRVLRFHEFLSKMRHVEAGPLVRDNKRECSTTPVSITGKNLRAQSVLSSQRVPSLKDSDSISHMLLDPGFLRRVTSSQTSEPE